MAGLNGKSCDETQFVRSFLATFPRWQSCSAISSAVLLAKQQFIKRYESRKHTKMDDVSIEFSVGDYGVETSVSSQKSSAESRNGRFFGAFRHDTKSSCFACMPNFALSSSTIGLDRQPETVEESNNKSTTTTDEESQHRNSSTLSNGLVTKKSTNETEQGSEHESSVAYADPFGKSWLVHSVPDGKE